MKTCEKCKIDRKYHDGGASKYDAIILCPRHAAGDELAEVLSELVGCNERWNADVQQIIGKPPTWTESYLDHARELLARLSEGQP